MDTVETMVAKCEIEADGPVPTIEGAIAQLRVIADNPGFSEAVRQDAADDIERLQQTDEAKRLAREIVAIDVKAELQQEKSNQ